MNVPGFSAEASHYKTSNRYQSARSPFHGRGAPGVSPQFFNPGINSIFRWCRGCLFCDARSHLCICYYPCPVVGLQGLM